MKKFEFLDVTSKAARAGFTEARMRAQLLTYEKSGFIYVSDLFVVSKDDKFLPPWSIEAYPVLRWIDHGCSILKKDFDDGVGRSPSYTLDGVMLTASNTARALQGKRTHLENTWIGAADVRNDIVPLRVVDRYRSDAEHSSVMIVQPEDLFFMETVSEPQEEKKSSRKEAGLMRIIGSMKELLMSKDGGDFPSQAKIIDQLVSRYGSAEGVSQRNLEKVFAHAAEISGSDLKPKP